MSLLVALSPQRMGEITFVSSLQLIPIEVKGDLKNGITAEGSAMLWVYGLVVVVFFLNKI